MSQAMVINGHGTKTKNTFQLNGHNLVTPESLEVPYIFSVHPNFAIENSFRQGQLYPIQNGHWQQYQSSQSIPDVRLDPWQRDEARTFAKRLLTDQSLWSNIDGQQGYLYQRDSRACLLVRNHNGVVALKGQDLLDYCEKLRTNSPVQGTPIAFISPHLGKVKILKETSLSEVLKAYQNTFGSQSFLLATCNAQGIDSKVVHLEVDKAPKPIEQVFNSPKPLLNAWTLSQAKPKPTACANDDELMLDKKHQAAMAC